MWPCLVRTLGRPVTLVDTSGEAGGEREDREREQPVSTNTENADGTERLRDVFLLMPHAGLAEPLPQTFFWLLAATPKPVVDKDDKCVPIHFHMLAPYAPKG